MHSIFARQSSGSRGGGFAASSRRPRRSVLFRDLWVQGNDALPSYKEGDTCASPGLGESTEAWKPSVSRPSCSSVRVTRKAHKILASADPMTSDSEHVAANAS